MESKIRSAIAWCKRNRIAIGTFVTIAAGIAHILAPGSHADQILVLIGTNLAAAGLFKSDDYHRDRQIEEGVITVKPPEQPPTYQPPKD